MRILPFLEFFTVRVVLDATDHEVGKMAVFVCNDVEKAVWTRKKGFSFLSGLPLIQQGQGHLLTFVVNDFLC